MMLARVGGGQAFVPQSPAPAPVFHSPPTSYHLLPFFSITFPLSTCISFVFFKIPASPGAAESRPFVFTDIPALLLHF